MDTRTRERTSFELTYSESTIAGDLRLTDLEWETDNRPTRSGVERMARPVSLERAYSLFGLLLGLIPMLSVIVRFSVHNDLSKDLGFSMLWLLASISTGFMGYRLGGRAARWEKRIGTYRLSWYLSLLPIVGISWGAVSGAFGGLFLLLIGSLFGAVIGGIIGLLAVLPFAVLIRLLSDEEHIEMKHLLPIAVGIPSTIAALWIGS